MSADPRIVNCVTCGGRGGWPVLTALVVCSRCKGTGEESHGTIRSLLADAVIDAHLAVPAALADTTEGGEKP